jgi:hypothetical protein
VACSLRADGSGDEFAGGLALSTFVADLLDSLAGDTQLGSKVLWLRPVRQLCTDADVADGELSFTQARVPDG